MADVDDIRILNVPRRVSGKLTPSLIGAAQSLPSRSSIPVAGYERNLHITEDGIVERGGGVMYFTNEADELVPIVMTTISGIIHEVIRTQMYVEEKVITSISEVNRKCGITLSEPC